MSTFLITARVKPESLEEVRRILAQGPPYDPDETSLERHLVFLSGGEVVFLFEGPRAQHEAYRLFADNDVLDQTNRLAAHLEGLPAVAEEIYGWTKSEDLPGVDFHALPGPGDSEGGLSE